MPRTHRLSLIAVALALAGLPLAAQQYKLVAPDGRVTYTDRPPADGSLRVSEVGKPEGAQAPASGPVLPPELRRLAERFPVILFSAPQCTPCDSGRDQLQRRGIPYRERQVLNNDDLAALERTVGSRTMPALTVGAQALSGYSETDWTSYLDAAGYPRESRLPANWTAPAPSPLVARLPAESGAAPTPPSNPAAAAVAPPAAPPSPAPANGTTIRF